MSVVTTLTDTWVVRRLFGTPKLIEGQLVDGIWYGNMGVAGDASGGVVILTGAISVGRKLDYVHQLRWWSIRIQGASSAQTFTVLIPTGPSIPSTTGINNPVFTRGGNMISGGASESSGGLIEDMQFRGLYIFGDQAQAGDATLLQATFNQNINGANFLLVSGGFLHLHHEFLR